MTSWKDKLKPIAHLRLDSFQPPVIPGNRCFAMRMCWYCIDALLLRGSLVGLLPSRVKASILRAFGARVGQGLVLKPRVSIKYPWFLEIGDHVWIGEGAWIDNHTTVRIGNHVCISQGAYIFTGNHDWSDPAFAFVCKPIEIGEGAWITAFQRVPPGAVIPPHHALVDK
ncbi:MAG: colanic acid biosynthesis acetyltransferase WcaF [Pseudomonadota bacterium]